MILIDTYKVVAHHYKIPMIEFVYSEPDPSLVNMINAILDEIKNDKIKA